MVADGLDYAMASVDVGHREYQTDHYLSVGRASTTLNDRCCVVSSYVWWDYVHAGVT
jgi:hypothetical protein